MNRQSRGIDEDYVDLNGEEIFRRLLFFFGVPFLSRFGRVLVERRGKGDRNWGHERSDCIMDGLCWDRMIPDFLWRMTKITLRDDCTERVPSKLY